jgi:hypothetical protein
MLNSEHRETMYPRVHYAYAENAIAKVWEQHVSKE